MGRRKRPLKKAHLHSPRRTRTQLWYVADLRSRGSALGPYHASSFKTRASRRRFVPRLGRNEPGQHVIVVRFDDSLIMVSEVGSRLLPMRSCIWQVHVRPYPVEKRRRKKCPASGVHSGVPHGKSSGDGQFLETIARHHLFANDLASHATRAAVVMLARPWLLCSRA